MRLAPRLRQHFGWPLLLLLASLGVAGLAAVQAQRASASHRQTAARLLQDYAAIAAWSYARRAEARVAEAAQQVLSPILHREMHGLGHWPGVELLARYREMSLAQCQCEPIFRPATYFAWSLGADTLGIAGVPIDAEARRALLDTLTPHIRGARPGARAGLVVARVHRTATLVAYGTMPMTRGDTMVYAFTFDSASVEAGFRDVARGSELLPPAVTRGLSNDSLLALCISPPGGPTFFSSGRFPRWKLQADAQLSATGGRLNVHATVRPEVAAALVAGGLPRSRTGYLVALVSLAGGLAVLAFRQLRREQQLARLRADFVAGVSHELRTPLAQMRMFLETLRLGRWQTDEQRDWLLGHVDRETARLSHLVENVLAFAAMSRDRQSDRQRAARLLPREVVDVGAEAADAARAFAPLAAARRATLRVETDGDAVAPLDRGRFRQVLLNLLDNAVKYGPAGQTVTVRVARAAASVRVTVDDEGPGVPRAERARVWDSYFRGTGEGTRVAGGSGIGLAIVRQIVVAHGGRAWVDDAPGGGARVVVELPTGEPHVCEACTGAAHVGEAQVGEAHACAATTGAPSRTS